jgi:hypothetical protein
LILTIGIGGLDIKKCRKRLSPITPYAGSIHHARLDLPAFAGGLIGFGGGDGNRGRDLGRYANNVDGPAGQGSQNSIRR